MEVPHSDHDLCEPEMTLVNATYIGWHFPVFVKRKRLEDELVAVGFRKCENEREPENRIYRS